MLSNSFRQGPNFYFSIRIKDHGNRREFLIDKCKRGNPFHYAHRLCNLVFKTPEETEKEILKRLHTTFDKYTALNGELIFGNGKRKRYYKGGSLR